MTSFVESNHGNRGSSIHVPKVGMLEANLAEPFRTFLDADLFGACALRVKFLEQFGYLMLHQGDWKGNQLFPTGRLASRRFSLICAGWLPQDPVPSRGCLGLEAGVVGQAHSGSRGFPSVRRPRSCAILFRDERSFSLLMVR